MTREELRAAVALDIAEKSVQMKPISQIAQSTIDLVLEAAAKAAASTCSECGGAEWLWAHEISGVGSLTDDTKYSCRLNHYHETCKAIAAICALKGE